MIIDLILDRKDDLKKGIDNYHAEEFYRSCFAYYQNFQCQFTENILNALDSGTNENIQNALCAYIDAGEYNPEIKNFIKQVDWLQGV